MALDEKAMREAIMDSKEKRGFGPVKLPRVFSKEIQFGYTRKHVCRFGPREGRTGNDFAVRIARVL